MPLKCPKSVSLHQNPPFTISAYANLKPKRWSNTQLNNGFDKSRKLQKKQALKLHEEDQVEINDQGNDLSNIETFAKHYGIEINIIDAEQFNSIAYTASKGSDNKIYLLKRRNHFDVIKSLTTFYDTPTIARSVGRHTPKETSTSVHQSVYLASPMQRIGNVRVTK